MEVLKEDQNQEEKQTPSTTSKIQKNQKILNNQKSENGINEQHNQLVVVRSSIKDKLKRKDTKNDQEPKSPGSAGVIDFKQFAKNIRRFCKVFLGVSSSNLFYKEWGTELNCAISKKELLSLINVTEELNESANKLYTDLEKASNDFYRNNCKDIFENELLFTDYLKKICAVFEGYTELEDL